MKVADQVPGRTLQTTSAVDCYDICKVFNGVKPCRIFEFNSNTKQCSVYSKTAGDRYVASAGTTIYRSYHLGYCKMEVFLLQTNIADTFLIPKMFFQNSQYRTSDIYICMNNWKSCLYIMVLIRFHFILITANNEYIASTYTFIVTNLLENKSDVKKHVFYVWYSKDIN